MNSLVKYELFLKSPIDINNLLRNLQNGINDTLIYKPQKEKLLIAHYLPSRSYTTIVIIIDYHNTRKCVLQLCDEFANYQPSVIYNELFCQYLPLPKLLRSKRIVQTWKNQLHSHS